MITRLINMSLWLSISLLAIGCSSKNQDFIPDKQPEELYVESYKAMSNDNFDLAKEYLEAINNRYPFGPYAHQVQLDLIYTYYKARENDLAIAEIDNFIRLNPSDENIDYVLYMRGLTNIQRATDRMLNFVRIDTYDRDISILTIAFNDFKKLYTMYPDSKYAADAFARMVHIRNNIARHELEVAKFYNKKQAYISSARRCQKILTSFKDTEVVEESLKILADDYEHLNLQQMAENTKQLLRLNYE